MRERTLLFALALSCTTAIHEQETQPPVAAPRAALDSAPATENTQPLVLAPGDVAELPLLPNGTALGRFATPAGTEQFVLIVGSTELGAAERSYDYSVSLAAAQGAFSSVSVADCSLAPHTPSSPAPEPAPGGEAPREGATRSIDVPSAQGVTRVTAKAISVGEHAIVWADTTNPTTLDLSFVTQFRDDFEKVILPRAREVFGTEPDTDHNGRIHLVFSRLTHDRAVAFFTACDLQPALAGCTASNHGEYLYLTPPDAIDPPYNTPNAIKEILAHELSHLLHFNRKVLRNALPLWPDGIYTAEGIGAFAQDVVGYQAGNLYVTKAGLDGIGDFSLTDVFAPRQREGAPDGVLRGVAYLFVRYLYDRAGGDSVSDVHVLDRGGPTFLRALLDAPRSVAEALPEVARARLSDVGMDFFTALAMSNRDAAGSAAPANPCFAFLPSTKDPLTGRQRGANLFASFHGMRMNGPRLGAAAAPDGKLRAGGVEYLELAAVPGTPEVDVTIHVDPAALGRVRVGRWK